MMVNTFLSQHAVFTVKELDRFLVENGSENRNTRKAILTYYRKQGRIVPVRRGLYAVVPLGSSPESSHIEPYHLAAKMSEDAVLAYHTALEFHGKAYSAFTRLHYVTARKSLPLKFRLYEIKGTLAPRQLRVKGKEMFGVTCQKHSGVDVRVTNFERTLVDVLDRPELCGSWEEIWRSLESVEFFDLDQVIEYVGLLENATTAAKVGFFLERHKEALMVDDAYLNSLRKLRPRRPHYMARGSRESCRWVKDWNLMIPIEILTRSWEEPL
ncbi:MAG: transcriptional regulator [Proteobacteria bacterium]|nr:transcriptional regulator [Pseudomonadota bacterium]